MLQRRLHVEALEDRRLLATVTVGNVSDVVNGTTTSIAALIATPGADGISLREAILAANADNSDPSDVINFAPSVTGEIQLTNVGHVGELAISSSLAINGPGAGALTIRAFVGTAALGDGARVFNVTDGNNGTLKDVAIGGLTVTGGDAAFQGGGIQSLENMTLSDVTLSGNFAANSQGGGLRHAVGNLTIVRSTISDNVAQSGGGIRLENSASIMISDSTISGNVASTNGTSVGGGGIDNRSTTGTVVIVNCTISGNSTSASGGGILVFNEPANLAIRHSTITNNRADIDNDGTGTGGGIRERLGGAILDHTIVAGNLRGTGAMRDDVTGAVEARFSLIGDNTGATITNNGGNQIGTEAAPINPSLGPLVNNGGSTLTHAFLVGSPAIDAGDSAAVAGVGTTPLTDQRGPGFARIVDGNGADGERIDIGAFEQQSTEPVSILVVDTLVDENDSNTSPGDFSLREAIGLANASIGPTTITFAESLTSGGPATILLTMGELSVTSSMAIDGPGASLLTIDASGNDPTPTQNNGDGSRVFSIDGNSTLFVSLSGLTLTGGDQSDSLFGSGGAIRNSEQLTLADCTIIENSTGRSGGGISSIGSLTLTRCSITGNAAKGGRGGGIDSLGELTMSDSVIEGNSASAVGGGISQYTSPMSVTNCTIAGNSSAGFGGGAISVTIGQSNSTIVGSTISGNTTSEGGGLRVVGDLGATGILTVTSSTISGNSATIGGGVAVQGNTVVIRDSTISGNTSTLAGGGIDVLNTASEDLTLINSTVSGNTTTGQGGGISLGQGSLTLLHSTVTGNRADFPGGGIFRYSGEVRLQHTIVAGNLRSASTRDDISGAAIARFSLIGDNTGAVIFNDGGNLIGTSASPINPQLGPLADNGGETLTHALLPGSPALNAGDPSAVAGQNDVAMFDQRGTGFNRIEDGRMDIGAYEVQVVEPSADFDEDGDVDGRDFLAWQRGHGITSPNAEKGDGDADNDTDVDGVDLGVWQDQYGGEELSAISSSDSGDATPGLALVDNGDDVALFVAAPTTPSVRGYCETEGHIETLYAEEVDFAFEELAAIPTSMRSFGEMVARRGVAKRVVLESVGSVFE